MNKRRICSFLMVLLLVSTVCLNIAEAFAGTDSVNASTTLSSYSVILSQGNGTGKININYDIQSKRTATSLGISTLKIYKSNGTLVTTITGTTSNGLVVENDDICFDTYTYTGTPGTSYYALATVFAEIGSNYDSHTIMTNTVTAPGP